MILSMTTTEQSYRHPLRGFSLVELMIAISLGLLIIAVVAGIFLSGNRNYAQDERYARVQENARFAMKTLSTDIASVAFWGGMTDASAIASIGTTCNITLNGGAAFVVLTDATAAAITTSYPCITAAKNNTSVMVVKRVQGACLAAAADTLYSVLCATTAPVPGRVYLRVNGTIGTLVTDTPVVVGDRYWEYIARIYYIRDFAVAAGDGIPTLVRIDLQAGTADVPLVEGIENFHVEAGTASGAYAPQPMQVYVLARSLDRDLAYDTDRAGAKTYQLGTTSCFTIAGTAPCVALATADGTPQRYYRRVFSSAVAVRNPGLLAQFR